MSMLQPGRQAGSQSAATSIAEPVTRFVLACRNWADPFLWML